jgi:hypothetical protein
MMEETWRRSDVGIAGKFLAAILVLFALSGCEDPIPTDYVPEYAFTGYIYAGEYPTKILLTRSLPPLDTFAYGQGEIPDARITIWSDADTIDLLYVPGQAGGIGYYRAVDTTKLIAVGTTYSMRAEMSDGTVLSASTQVPAQVEWIREPPKLIQYPKDTIYLTASTDTLIWSLVPGVDEYLIEVKALDTLNYGQYLEPPTDEPNRRIERFFEANAPRYDDVVRWGFVQNTRVTVVWFAFKWFGLHDITIYAPDPALLEWFKQVRFGGNRYNHLLSNIDGGIGVFGSASRRTAQGFLVKNQP